jgi:hypothetical protein
VQEFDLDVHSGLPPDGWAVDLVPGGRRTARWVATGQVPGPARSLALCADGTAVVAYDPPRGADTEPVVQVRTGTDLEQVVAEYPGLAAPVAVSPAGRRFVAAEQSWSSRTTRLDTGLRLVNPDAGGTGTHWSLRGLAGWVPGPPDRFVALNRHPFARKEPVTGPSSDVLTVLETEEISRVVLADPAGDHVEALAPSPALAEALYQEPNLAVTAAMAVVATCNRLIGLPLDGGLPHWTQPPREHPFHFVMHWYAAATSACGRLVAFGGSHWNDDPNLLVVEAATGRLLLARDTRSLGTAAPVRAIAFHPAGWLAVGFGDGQVRHLTLTGSMVAYRGIPGGLAALAFTPDGTALLVAGGTDRGLRRVELTPAEHGR